MSCPTQHEARVSKPVQGVSKQGRCYASRWSTVRPGWYFAARNLTRDLNLAANTATWKWIWPGTLIRSQSYRQRHDAAAGRLVYGGMKHGCRHGSKEDVSFELLKR